LGKEAGELEDALFRLLSEYCVPETGAWHEPNAPTPPVNIRINGAMKALSGLAWLTPRPMDYSALINFCLQTLLQNDSCSLLNQLFVLEQTTKEQKSGRSRYLAADAAVKLMKQSLNFYHWSEGAFSFFPHKAQTHYYGVPVSHGEHCADLHGTAMQTWALALAAGFLGIGGDWTTQKV
jgi:hypothetical protein